VNKLQFPDDKIITSLSVNETESSLRLEQNSALENQLLMAFLLLLIFCKYQIVCQNEDLNYKMRLFQL